MLARREPGGEEAQLVIDEGDALRMALRRRDELFRFGSIESGRLLGQHVFAGRERGEGHLPMFGWRSDDRDEVDIRRDDRAPVVEGP
jgi:hypothetical protein